MSDSALSTLPNRGGAPKGNRNAVHHGAPRGNTNALKFGLCSCWFTRDERTRLDRDSLGQLQDQENSLNIVIDRIFAAMKSEKMDFERTLAAARAISLACGRIESINRSRKVIYNNQTLMEQAMEELRYLPPDQD